MDYKDGDFVKVIKDNGQYVFGLLMNCGENHMYKILILGENGIENNFDDEPETIICYDDKGKLVDKKGLKIIAEKVDNMLISEELRQAYNLYVE